MNMLWCKFGFQIDCIRISCPLLTLVDMLFVYDSLVYIINWLYCFFILHPVFLFSFWCPEQWSLHPLWPHISFRALSKLRSASFWVHGVMAPTTFLALDEMKNTTSFHQVPLGQAERSQQSHFGASNAIKLAIFGQVIKWTLHPQGTWQNQACHFGANW